MAAQLGSFYTATATLMILTLIAFGLGWYFEKHLPVLPIISGFFVIISGLFTLIYQAPDALIFANTLYYLLMGLTIGIGLLYKVNIFKKIFGRVFAMTDTGWLILARRWVVVFLLGGILNELVRLLATPDVWVDFKVIKVVMITVFGLYQFTLTRRYRLPEESSPWGLRL